MLKLGAAPNDPLLGILLLSATTYTVQPHSQIDSKLKLSQSPTHPIKQEITQAAMSSILSESRYISPHDSDSLDRQLFYSHDYQMKVKLRIWLFRNILILHSLLIMLPQNNLIQNSVLAIVNSYCAQIQTIR